MRRLHGPHTPHRFLFLLATAPDDEDDDDDKATPPAVTPDDDGDEDEGQGEELACCWQSVSPRWPPVIWKALPASEIPPPADPMAMTMTPGGNPSPPRKLLPITPPPLQFPPSDRPIMSGWACPCLFMPPQSAPPP